MSNINKEITDPTRWRVYVTKIANTFNQSQEIKEDLIQEGYIAIWKASLAFKGDNERDWINYMTTAIKNGMKAYLIKYSNTIRTPIKLIGQDNLIKVTNLDTPINEDGGTLHDVIGSEVSEEDKDYSRLRMALMKLKDKERILIEMYFGFHDKPPMNYREIGEEMGTSRQNIEEKIKKVLNKLKNNGNIN